MIVLVDLLYRFRKRLLVIYGLAVVTLYLIPASGLHLDAWFIFGVRKDHFFHALMFTPLAMLLFDEKTRGRVVLAVIAAPAVELIHLLVPWRSFSGWDMLANASGALIGIIARFILLRLKD